MLRPERIFIAARARSLILVLAILAGLVGANPAAARPAALLPPNFAPASRVLGQSDFTSGASGGQAAGMNHPNGVAVDPITGKVFVADSGNHRVLRFARLAELYDGEAAEAVLGQADILSVSPGASQSKMSYPRGLAVDRAGRLWVADFNNSRVLRFDNAAWKASGANADGVLGQPDFSSSSQATSQSRMTFPGGVAVDPNGRLWVADSNNNRVLRFDNAAAKANGANADGVLGQADFNSHAPATSQTGMSIPANLVVDGDGRLWVVEFNNARVLRFDHAAAKANGAKADGVLGQLDFNSSAPATSPSGMRYPSGLAVDSLGQLWVADTYNQRILRFVNAAALANGANADWILGQPDFTSSSPNNGSIAANTLNYPSTVMYDPFSDTLWAADTLNNRALAYGDARLTLIAPGGLSGNDSPIAYLNYPPAGFDLTDFGGFVLGQGITHTFVISNTGLMSLSLLGALPVRIGGANPGDFSVSAQPITPLGTNQATHFSILFNPSAPGVRQAQVTIANSDGDANPFIFNIQGAGGSFKDTNYHSALLVVGQPDLNSRGIGSGASGLFAPYSVAVDPISGKVFVADAGHNRVLRFPGTFFLFNGVAAEAVLGQPDFTSSSPATSREGMRFPSGVTVDASGRLWVVDQDNSRVLRFDNAATKPNGAGADGVLGQKDFTSRILATSQSGFFNPSSAAVDSDGRLWVADSGNSRVLRFDQAAAKTDGANADGELGQPDFSSSFQAALRDRMHTPQGVAVDPTGRLWVVDQDNSRVLRFDNAAAKFNGQGADGVLGQADFTSSGPDTSPSGMYLPRGASVDPAGRLWVVDTNNQRVLRFDNAAAKPDGASAEGVLGQHNFSYNVENNGLLVESLSYPVGAFYDPLADALWVADSGNQRVLVFSDPMVVLRVNDHPIANGAETPSPSNGTDFGAADLGLAVEQTFTVTNQGLAPLVLSGSPRVQINAGARAGSAAPGDFSVTVQPGPAIAPHGSTSFTIRFSPSQPGLRQAWVSIATSDSKANPYTFAIQGTGGAFRVYLPLARGR